MLVLDTDLVSLLEWRETALARRLQDRIDAVRPDEIATTIISFEEQTRGWLATLARTKSISQQVDAYRRLSKHLDAYRQIPVLDFDELAATHFQHLLKLRLRIPTMDLKIAAVVLAHDATLLSRNLKDFRRVPGLRVEDWAT